MMGTLTRVTRPVWMSLLATSLSGCTGFSESIDDEQAYCPTVNIPENYQPFDTIAQKQLQRLIDRNNKNPAESTTFVRLKKQGVSLSNRQARYSSEPWACVKDNRTGLTWEVKTNDRSLRDTRWTYTWYELPRADENRYIGKADGGKCLAGSTCDTQAYVAAVNAGKLCGHDDWRLPQAFELHTILDRKNSCPGTCIDQGYFPNTTGGGYWSSSPFDEFVCYAWGVDFELGAASGAYKDTPLHIRVVRGKRLVTSSRMK